MSTITTHILDTGRGCPAVGVGVILYRLGEGSAVRKEIARGSTNKDGRITDWMEPVGGAMVPRGVYAIRFETKPYFDQQSVASFYPFVEIHFEINSDGHYHIPLLISPFGYTTYRGS